MARPAFLRCRAQQVLAHLAPADAIGRSTAHRWGHLAEVEDLIQVAREALVRSIQGALLQPADADGVGAPVGAEVRTAAGTDQRQA